MQDDPMSKCGEVVAILRAAIGLLCSALLLPDIDVVAGVPASIVKVHLCS